MDARSVGLVATAAVGALIPTGLYALFAWWFDRYEKEPLRLIGAALLWGLPAAALAAFLRPALLNWSALLFGPVPALMWGNALMLPIAEELLKGLFLLGIFLLYAQEIDSLYDGFLYGSLVGFAFAAADTVLSAPARGWGLGDAIGRTFLLGLGHAFFTAWTGLGFAAARLGRGGLRYLWPVLGGLAAVLLHILRDLALVPTLWNPGLAGLRTIIYLAGLVLLLGLVLYGMSRESGWIARYLAEEVEAGLLPRDLYNRMRSPSGWLTYRWAPLLRGDVAAWRRRGMQRQLAAELAFRKHQWRTLGEARWEAEVQRLREALRQFL